MSIVLMLGSGPDVLRCRDWPRAPFDTVVAINNAWQVRPDWDALVYPEDFPPERRPQALAPGQRAITAADFVPAQNAYGGFVYAGGTMAFTASYWALHALRPRVIAYIGCDMVYPKGPQTHFYGKGTADPLRRDKTLRSLEAKSARLMAMAAQQGCALVNLGTGASRLVFPHATPADLAALPGPARPDRAAFAAAIRAEARAGYMVPSGRYWEEEDRFDTAVIDRIDAAWLSVAGQKATAA
ncbi:MAG: hypothetical protein GC146_10350 [Limimaricola sp.]|uniref:hypothetical protein n=1 Tax=Limimaricola sp. TaxID=2211665 RepID=UPI001DFA2DC0|nr:hypothetical protein [Limimaricola sp.]MBI1417610.1 hypothetical protein [Limimaricola sp.]